MDTPFHSLGHLPITPDEGKYRLLKDSSPAIITDHPTISQLGYKFEAISTAKDKTTDQEFGAVEWGFEVRQDNQGNPQFVEYTPTLLEGNLQIADDNAGDRRDGRQAAFKQWNQTYPPQKEQSSNSSVTRIP
ncbi:hypothetical protein [Nostoc sp. LEGE 12450]|uniref:hypothetical protein n=1 Tax=Nostoc sp. LEGE 12450 TaxID=1828643 RepID=UPI00187FE922|nr:hypothetical protein [Nostoc sp. LEGE 12450]MBE8986743.1 hypothetical protein [Nostoc sp. LEGE 12450]